MSPFRLGIHLTNEVYSKPRERLRRFLGSISRGRETRKSPLNLDRRLSWLESAGELIFLSHARDMAKKSTTQPGPAAPVAPPTPITWPAITKPTTPLVPVTLYPGLVLVDDFFSAKTVSTWLTFLTSPSSPITFEPSPPGPPNRGYAARSNDRFGTVDEEFSRRLWEESGLREICEGALVKGSTKKPVGLNPNIRLYRYFPSALFGRKVIPLLRLPLGEKLTSTMSHFPFFFCVSTSSL